AGLIYDTGGFRHSSTSPETMKIAGELMGYGIPFTEIYNRFFDSRSFSELKIMGRALDHAELLYGGAVVVSTITTAEIQELGGSNKELDAIINYLKGVLGAKIACFFYEKTETDVKGSFRGNDGYDVCALAQKFGGGGHVKAAGCTITAPIAEAKAMVLAEVEKML
ncbi:MAG: DHHA1 domain-containing protein, partial [Bacillota bacterium]|nr:DHHA1 domain-containing protein [Bacillota bacterium]